MTRSDLIQAAIGLPNGAHFFRCALQVNPFAYLKANSKGTPFDDERSYNEAIVQACQAERVDAIAVTNHYDIEGSRSLLDAARAGGIEAFPGFEAVTKDGVHLLCVFDLGADIKTLDRIIGDCGVHRQAKGSPTGKYDVTEFLAESKKWGALCIAAHVAGEGGLLRKLAGRPRINAWTAPELLACSLPGSIADAPNELRPILENKDGEHRRDRSVAVLNAKDVSGPEGIREAGASCWIKMASVSLEGLRQAFLDPGSRIRLSSDPALEEHSEIVALTWEGGFLDGAAIHFNSNLNVLVGGRGTGKSTVVESLRYVLGLDTVGDDARKAHEGIVRHVLGNAAKVSLLVRSHRPTAREYRIERTVPNPAVVRDEQGQVSSLSPRHVLPRVEVYGQHEIAELAKSREKLTRLLDRFVERDPSITGRKADARSELEKTRRQLNEIRTEFQQIQERLAALPGLEETLKRFQEAGLEERLQEQSLLVREERVLKAVGERIDPVRTRLAELQQIVPIDRAFLSPRALEDLPAKAVLARANAALETLEHGIGGVVTALAEAIARAEQGVAAVRGEWEVRRRDVQGRYEKILRELQKSRVDGEEFIRLRRQIEDLRPLRERETQLQRLQAEQEQRRRAVLAEWEDLKAEEFRLLDRAAKKVSRKLRDKVRVEVAASGDREPLGRILREEVGGRLSEAIDLLIRVADLSLPTLVDSCRSGAAALVKQYRLPPAQAERLAKAAPDVLMRMEELELPPTTRIELNTSAPGEPPAWQSLDDLSTGQKATAVLLLLLLESDAPLIVDQPEDDLDNRFITEGVVPRMREEKRRRQFVFSSHNANIPVLGDAELILGLIASGEAGHGSARIPSEQMGSIDSTEVRELVEEILEGGKDAFEMRRLKYGF